MSATTGPWSLVLCACGNLEPPDIESLDNAGGVTCVECMDCHRLFGGLNAAEAVRMWNVAQKDLAGSESPS